MRRVAKKSSKGNVFRFRALVAVGDGKGVVGVGIGKANEVPEAIRKAGYVARKNLIRVPLLNDTIPYPIQVKFKTAKVLLKAAAPGTGLIAGSSVRAVLEVCGVKNVISKSLGANNPINLCQATLLALSKLVDPQKEKQRRGEVQTA